MDRDEGYAVVIGSPSTAKGEGSGVDKGPGVDKRSTPASRVQTRRQRFRKDRMLLLMVLPGLILFAAFYYIPLLGNVIAFQDYLPFVGIWKSPFVGLDNFTQLFADAAFWNALRNTLIITFLNITLFFPIPIGIALMLDTMFHEKTKSIVRSTMFLPHFIGWVVIVALFQQILGNAGVINQFLLQHGLGTIDIIGNASIFKLLLVAQVTWKDAGWATIIFIAALASVDSSLYESAAVDGAGYWKRLWHISLPGMRGVIILLLILRLGDALSVGFEQILLQRDAVGPHAGEVLDTYIYFFGVQGGNWSIAAAAGVLKGAVGLLLVLGANTLAHKLGEDGVYTRK